MTIEQVLKNVLAVLDRMMIPGSESIKMTAVKNDINAVIRAVQEHEANPKEAKEKEDAENDHHDEERGDI